MSSQRHKFYLLTRWEDTWSQNYFEQNESCFFSEIFSNQRILNSMWKKLENQGMSVSNVHTYINMYMCILGIFLCTNLRLQHPAIFCAWKNSSLQFWFQFTGAIVGGTYDNHLNMFFCWIVMRAKVTDFITHIRNDFDVIINNSCYHNYLTNFTVLSKWLFSSMENRCSQTFQK